MNALHFLVNPLSYPAAFLLLSTLFIQPLQLNGQTQHYRNISMATDAPSSSGTWRLRRKVDNIRVFYRQPPDSKIMEIKTIAEARTTMPEILSLISKVKDFPNWVYHCKKAYWLNRSTDSTGVYYCEIGFPWPIRNRDFIARTQLHRNPAGETVEIHISGLPEYLPPKDNIVRMPELHIEWTLIPLSDDRTRLEYQLRIDPGGDLPVWLVNLAIDRGPLKSMQGLLDRL